MVEYTTDTVFTVGFSYLSMSSIRICLGGELFRTGIQSSTHRLLSLHVGNACTGLLHILMAAPLRPGNFPGAPSCSPITKLIPNVRPVRKILKFYCCPVSSDVSTVVSTQVESCAYEVHVVNALGCLSIGGRTFVGVKAARWLPAPPVGGRVRIWKSQIHE